VNAFVSRFLQGGTKDPGIAIKPPSTKFNLDLTAAINWTTPPLK